MKKQSSFAERVARIEARARNGENHGFVEPGVIDPDVDTGPSYFDKSGGGVMRGVARAAVGAVAMLSVTALAFVAGLWVLLPEEDATALGIVARDMVMDHLSLDDGVISDAVDPQN